MGRHMRNHEVGTATRTGTTRPTWPTIDRQPTEPFAVNLARCQGGGDSLRTVAGGGWQSKLTGSETCPGVKRRPWRRHRAHVISAARPPSPWSPDRLLVVLLVLGPTVLLVAIATVMVVVTHR